MTQEHSTQSDSNEETHDLQDLGEWVQELEQKHDPESASELLEAARAENEELARDMVRDAMELGNKILDFPTLDVVYPPKNTPPGLRFREAEGLLLDREMMGEYVLNRMMDVGDWKVFCPAPVENPDEVIEAITTYDIEEVHAGKDGKEVSIMGRFTAPIVTSHDPGNYMQPPEDTMETWKFAFSATYYFGDDGYGEGTIEELR